MYRRGKIEILTDILELCITPVKKTTIVYRCNLNFLIVKKYLERCFNNGWLREERIDSRNLYMTTELGKEALDTFNQSISLVQF